jgi:hypothetical protein
MKAASFRHKEVEESWIFQRVRRFVSS